MTKTLIYMQRCSYTCISDLIQSMVTLLQHNIVIKRKQKCLHHFYLQHFRLNSIWYQSIYRNLEFKMEMKFWHPQSLKYYVH